MFSLCRYIGNLLNSRLPISPSPAQPVSRPAPRQYIIIVNWVLLQVSVAVLLDNFVRASVRIEDDAKAALVAQKRAEAEIKNPLEPLLVHLIKVLFTNVSSLCPCS